MKTKTLFYCVVQDYNGEWSVSSYMGRTVKEEKRFALTCNKQCVLITKHYELAQRRAQAERRATNE